MIGCKMEYTYKPSAGCFTEREPLPSNEFDERKNNIFDEQIEAISRAGLSSPCKTDGVKTFHNVSA